MKRIACAVAVAAACGHSRDVAHDRARDPARDPAQPGETIRSVTQGQGAIAPGAAPGAAPRAEPSQDEVLAAIQKAMNELDEAAQQCWAAAATERFDIAGELALQIDIAPGGSRAQVVHDTVRNTRLSACVVRLLGAYPWAPPLHGRSIQLPFKFRAPDGQSTIDRSLVAWNGQGKVSVAVLLDENNAGNDAASMFELAIDAGGTTGLRWADRAELWYFLGAGEVAWAGGKRSVAAGDMMYAPRGSAREVRAPAVGAALHAVVVVVPGGREGAARGGALPTREVTGATPRRPPIVLPAAAARSAGSAAIYAEPATIHDSGIAAAIVALPAGTRLAEHAHGESELWYLLDGRGSLTVNGVELAVTPTSVVQIPRNGRHAFVAASDVRALQIYAPAGPEPRFKDHP